MEALRQYIISVTAAAMITGILSGIVKNSPAKELLRMLCGLFLAIVFLRPIWNLDPNDMLPDTFLDFRAGKGSAAVGEKIARSAMADIIKSETEAYILDKASAMGVTLTATVTLSEDTIPIPVAAQLTGNISPYHRKQLSNILQTELGITEENQLWTG